jgi:hypothetical protein
MASHRDTTVFRRNQALLENRQQGTIALLPHVGNWLVWAEDAEDSRRALPNTIRLAHGGRKLTTIASDAFADPAGIAS